jgi:hypothetical protein
MNAREHLHNSKQTDTEHRDLNSEFHVDILENIWTSEREGNRRSKIEVSLLQMLLVCSNEIGSDGRGMLQVYS